jgi:fibronectin-binding autotransporter adhesin
MKMELLMAWVRPLSFVRWGMGLAALLSASRLALAAQITFDAPVTVAGDTDVIATDSLRYAYTWSNVARSVNGVPFAATAINVGAVGGGTMTLAGFGATNGTVFTSTANPFNALSVGYKALLVGATYSSVTTGTVGTVTLNNLTIGTGYRFQLWVGDPRAGGTATRTMTIGSASAGSNSRLVDYNVGNVGGGVGQYVVGNFTADATTQSFTVTAPSGSTPHINAFQLRTAAPAAPWSGAISGTWDDTTANFSGQTFAQIKAANGSAVFADTTGSGAAVTQTAVTIQAGGVTGAAVSFTNNTITYSLNSTDANGLTGSQSLSKIVGGGLRLLGANTFSGDTNHSGGVLTLGHTAALQNSTLNTTGGSVAFSSIGMATLGGLKGTTPLSLQAAAAAPVALTVGGNGQSPTMMGDLSGAGSLIKTGTGTLTLGGTSTHSGGTTLTAGTLSVTGVHTGSGLSVAGGTLTYASGSTTTVGLASLSQSGGKIVLDLASSGSDVLAVTGDVTFSGGVIELNPLSLPPINTPITLMTYGGSLTGIPTVSHPLRMPYTLNVGSGSASLITITFTAPPASLVWSGSVSGEWSATPLNNWLNAGLADRFYPLDSVLFDDTGITKSVTLPSAVLPHAVTIRNSVGPTLTYTVAGVISGQSVTKEGPGTAIFTGANTYVGPTVISEGTLQLGSGGATGTIASTSAVSLAAAGTLRMNHNSGGYAFNNALSGSGTVALLGVGGSGQSAYLPGGDNSGFSGLITADRARINVDASPADLGTARVKVLDGGQIYSASLAALSNPIEITGLGWPETAGVLGAIRLQAATLSGPITLTGSSRIACHGSTGSLTGPISESGGAHALEFRGTSATANSAFTVASSSSRTGPTSVVGAVLTLQTGSGLGSGALTIASSGTAARVTRVDVQNVTLTQPIALNSDAQTNTLGVLHAIGGGISTLLGPITMSLTAGNGGHLSSDALSTLRIMGSLTPAGGVTPVIQSGTVELGGGGTYPSLSVVGGTVRLAASNGVAAGALFDASTTAPVTLDLNGFSQTLEGITGSATTTVTNAAATPAHLTLSSTANRVLAGAIKNTGVGPLSLTKSGSGDLTLNGANAYAGHTTVTAGRLVISSPFLSDTGDVRLSATSTLQLAFVGTDVVQAFMIDGVPQPAGVWGAVGSGALHESPRLTGSGLLLVIDGPLPSAFSTWVDNFLTLTALSKAASADPDGDGASNFVEFAFGSDPTQPGASGSFFPATDDTDGDGHAEPLLVLAVREGAVFTGSPTATAMVDGIIYEVSASTDLDTFNGTVAPLGSWSGGLAAPGGYEWQRFRISTVGGLPSRGFLRASARAASGPESLVMRRDLAGPDPAH